MEFKPDRTCFNKKQIISFKLLYQCYTDAYSVPNLKPNIGKPNLILKLKHSIRYLIDIGNISITMKKIIGQ